MPHPQSVLDPAIADYRQDFFDKLADMEAYTYDQSQQDDGDGGTAGVDEYQPFWQSYSDAIMGYFGSSISGLNDFLLGLNGFLVNYLKRGRGAQSLYDDSDAFAVFDLNGLVDDVLGYPVDYYDDYSHDGFSGSAPNLESDTSRANSAFSSDQSALDSLTQNYSDSGQGFAVGDVYTGDTPPMEGPFPAEEAWPAVFEDLNWQVVLEQFGESVPTDPRTL